MSLYHAGAVMASNYVVALADVARSLLVAAGHPRGGRRCRRCVPLMTSAVRNLVEIGPARRALTGPVARGDVGSVERHLEALAARAAREPGLYQRLGREVLAHRPQARRPTWTTRPSQRLAGLFE